MLSRNCWTRSSESGWMLVDGSGRIIRPEGADRDGCLPPLPHRPLRVGWLVGPGAARAERDLHHSSLLWAEGVLPPIIPGDACFTADDLPLPDRVGEFPGFKRARQGKVCGGSPSLADDPPPADELVRRRLGRRGSRHGLRLLRGVFRSSREETPSVV